MNSECNASALIFLDGFLFTKAFLLSKDFNRHLNLDGFVKDVKA